MPRAVSFVGVVIAHLVAITGCYEPAVRDCTVQCSAATDCTGGQVCGDDGWCAMPTGEKCPKGGAGDNDDAMADAAAGPSDTGPSLCPLGCTNGTCVAGVCVIDCSAAQSCQDDDITCPPNLPCRVLCGERSCAKKVFCGHASSCEVQCAGDNSCQDEIVCNDHRCTVACTGTSSCKRTKCGNACACDVTCVGLGSCLDSSECPDSSCRLGEGCSSQLAGCNQC